MKGQEGEERDKCSVSASGPSGGPRRRSIRTWGGGSQGHAVRWPGNCVSWPRGGGMTCARRSGRVIGYPANISYGNPYHAVSSCITRGTLDEAPTRTAESVVCKAMEHLHSITGKQLTCVEQRAQKGNETIQHCYLLSPAKLVSPNVFVSARMLPGRCVAAPLQTRSGPPPVEILWSPSPLHTLNQPLPCDGKLTTRILSPSFQIVQINGRVRLHLRFNGLTAWHALTEVGNDGWKIVPILNRGRSLIFAHGNRVKRCRWSAGFLGDIPFSPSLIPAPLHTHLASPSLAFKALVLRGSAVAERLACPRPTKANQAQFLVGSLPDFRMWESCRTMPLVGGFSRGSLVSPALSFRPAPYSPQTTSSALKTSLLRATQIYSLTHSNNRTEDLPRRDRGMNARSSDYMSATLPQSYGDRRPLTLPIEDKIEGIYILAALTRVRRPRKHSYTAALPCDWSIRRGCSCPYNHPVSYGSLGSRSQDRPVAYEGDDDDKKAPLPLTRRCFDVDLSYDRFSRKRASLKGRRNSPVGYATCLPGPAHTAARLVLCTKACNVNKTACTVLYIKALSQEDEGGRRIRTKIVVGQRPVGTSCANQRLVTHSPAGSPANTELLPACSSQSGMSSVFRASRSRLAHWLVRLARFKFNVQHIRGVDNSVGDALTRMHCAEEFEQGDEKMKNGATVESVASVNMSPGACQFYGDNVTRVPRGKEPGVMAWPAYALCSGRMCDTDFVGLSSGAEGCDGYPCTPNDSQNRRCQMKLRKCWAVRDGLPSLRLGLCLTSSAASRPLGGPAGLRVRARSPRKLLLPSPVPRTSPWPRDASQSRITRVPFQDFRYRRTVSPLASHQGDPAGSLGTFHTWESCPGDAVGRRIFPNARFNHHRRLSRPRCEEPPEHLRSLATRCSDRLRARVKQTAARAPLSIAIAKHGKNARPLTYAAFSGRGCCSRTARNNTCHVAGEATRRARNGPFHNEAPLAPCATGWSSPKTMLGVGECDVCLALGSVLIRVGVLDELRFCFSCAPTLQGTVVQILVFPRRLVITNSRGKERSGRFGRWEVVFRYAHKWLSACVLDPAAQFIVGGDYYVMNLVDVS
ncbi:hypothetical protein PR048_000285 [Dryococelus australis]|uniref:Uncharacterized protein n=1 Tax=Dryococelus australis TaxID=614101 RepID=A0ABQ9IE88_9NEOP|nr:hypothetical protein PR048_000285 [Dryococelus australis]